LEHQLHLLVVVEQVHLDQVVGLLVGLVVVLLVVIFLLHTLLELVIHLLLILPKVILEETIVDVDQFMVLVEAVEQLPLVLMVVVPLEEMEVQVHQMQF
tara:strand:- start:338 stop:634 length:297 start_codon:yes stop_codon:yes gene_type:complete